jgi:DtxR family Mn-dependent transcriptional regulator
MRNSISTAAEDCLLAVHRLTERSVPVTTSQLAHALGVRDSTVTAMAQRLARNGLLNYLIRKEMSLTERGLSVARSLTRRHRLIETFLWVHMGYSWEEIHDEADKFEHIVSEKFVDVIDRQLGGPRIDPHGDPIPDKCGNEAQRQLRPLSSVGAGWSGKIARVLKTDPQTLVYLSDLGLHVGARLAVIDIPEHDTYLHLQISGRACTLGREIASQILVEQSS